MLPHIGQEWVQALPVKKHEDISEQDSERMPRKQIPEAFPCGRLQILLLGHDRKRPDMCPPELGIMLMMIIMRAAPHTTRRQRVNPKNPHEQFRDPGAIQNRVMLLIVVNHEDRKSVV